MSRYSPTLYLLTAWSTDIHSVHAHYCQYLYRSVASVVVLRTSHIWYPKPRQSLSRDEGPYSHCRCLRSCCCSGARAHQAPNFVHNRDCTWTDGADHRGRAMGALFCKSMRTSSFVRTNWNRVEAVGVISSISLDLTPKSRLSRSQHHTHQSSNMKKMSNVSSLS